jgi:hypothetical protein
MSAAFDPDIILADRRAACGRAATANPKELKE